MKIDFLPEPELQFGTDKHIDIRFGIMHYGPLDYESALAPKNIKAGIVGTPETIEGVQQWLERCRNEIPAKSSKQPNLFPRFPGFNSEESFRASLILDTKLQRSILQSEFDQLIKKSALNELTVEAA